MIKLYDTQKRDKCAFTPLHDKEIRMYVCGPTVYNYVHIGNARTFVSFDVIRRYLAWRGYAVRFVSNITDVDDKIIARAAEEHKSASEIAQFYTQAFIEDMHALHVLDPDIRPKATQEIPEMIEFIESLIHGGHAYVSAGDVYFSVRSLEEYGALSHKNIDELESGHRQLRFDTSHQGKRDDADFALWKEAKPGEPAWESPWGLGRPGWHLECSAMTRKYLGYPFDIHGGGCDLIFPHHENERAQAIAAYHTGFANYWLHTGMLQINSEKMSKSLGNFLLLRTILETVDANDLRFLMLQAHYRSSLDFSDDALEGAKTALARIKNTVSTLTWICDAQQENGAGAGAGDAGAGTGDAGAGAGDANAGECSAVNASHDAAQNNNAHDAAAQDDAAQQSAALVREREAFLSAFRDAMDDDFNTPRALGVIFDYCGVLNTIAHQVECTNAPHQQLQASIDALKEIMNVLGISNDAFESADDHYVHADKLVALAETLARELEAEGEGAAESTAENTAQHAAQGVPQTSFANAQEAADYVLEVRAQARRNKCWQRADAIRDQLKELGYCIEDTPQGARLIHES